jgi:hypothetical protein
MWVNLHILSSSCSCQNHYLSWQVNQTRLISEPFFTLAGQPNSAQDLVLGITLERCTDGKSDCSPPIVVGEPGDGELDAGRLLVRAAASCWGVSMVTAKVDEKAVERRNRCPLRAAAAAAAVTGARQALGRVPAASSDSDLISSDRRKLLLWVRWFERSDVTPPAVDIAAADTMAARRNGEPFPRWTASNCSPAHPQHANVFQFSSASWQLLWMLSSSNFYCLLYTSTRKDSRHVLFTI